MAIPYSLALRLAKPGFPEKGNKTYPVAQYYQLLDLGKMAAHMAGHASKYSKGDIMAVTTELTSCIREQLLLGNKIQLGDLGAFSVTLISKGADNAESFSTSLIQKVKVHWEPSAEFTDLLNDCEFEFVGTRILGVVFNGISSQRGRYNKYYRKYYGQAYYDASKKKS